MQPPTKKERRRSILDAEPVLCSPYKYAKRRCNGRFRTYDYAVALRAVKTIDFMTAESAEIPYAVLNKVMNRIINEVKGVNRVFYDLTSKPPGTIEFE